MLPEKRRSCGQNAYDGSVGRLYQGAFDSWLCIENTGDIYHEQGTISQGVCVGEYTADVYFGEKSTDLYTLWYNRKRMEFTTYKGKFDRNGKTLLEQPSVKEMDILQGTGEEESAVIYAYDEEKKKFLYVRPKDETEGAVFDIAALGIGPLLLMPPMTFRQMISAMAMQQRRKWNGQRR